VVFSLIARGPGPLDHPAPAWAGSSLTDKMTTVSPPRGAAPMTLPDTLVSDLAKEVQVPDKGILSRTLSNNDRLKVVTFGFAHGEELSEHTASMPAVLHFLQGEATATLGVDRHEAKPGTWVHMPAGLKHSIRATTPVVLVLLLLK
jgi:quercetin dioxygenase-like cupin family protein